MSATTDALLGAAKTAAQDQVWKVLARSKVEFLDTFAGFVQKADLVALEELFLHAATVKADQYTAATEQEAQDFADQYEAVLERIETIGDRYEIVGKAKAGKLMRSFAHQAISGAFAVAGAVLQAGLGVALPGVGSLIGAGVNIGVQHVVAYFLGD